jgi:hypothetical protein
MKIGLIKEEKLDINIKMMFTDIINELLSKHLRLLEKLAKKESKSPGLKNIKKDELT